MHFGLHCQVHGMHKNCDGRVTRLCTIITATNSYNAVAVQIMGSDVLRMFSAAWDVYLYICCDVFT